MSEKDKPKNLLQRIDDVMRAVEYVRKDTKVQGYNAITHDEVLSAIRAQMIKAGIKVMVTNIEYTHEQIHSVKNNEAKVTYSTICNLEMTYFNQDTPTDYIKTYSVGHGIDSLDKSTGKAMTYARKNNYLATFMLETGIDDEARRDSKAVFEINEKQAQEIRDLIAECDKICKNPVNMIEFLKLYKVDDIEEMSIANYEAAKVALNTRKNTALKDKTDVNT